MKIKGKKIIIDIYGFDLERVVPALLKQIKLELGLDNRLKLYLNKKGKNKTIGYNITEEDIDLVE